MKIFNCLLFYCLFNIQCIFELKKTNIERERNRDREKNGDRERQVVIGPMIMHGLIEIETTQNHDVCKYR